MGHRKFDPLIEIIKARGWNTNSIIVKIVARVRGPF